MLDKINKEKSIEDSLFLIAKDISHPFNFIGKKAQKNQLLKSFLSNEIVYIPKSLFKYDSIALQIKYLPDKLLVNGDLDLERCILLKEMPKISLKVMGNLTLPSQIDELPPELFVKGTLNIQGSEIDSIPEKSVIGGLIGNKYLMNLPNIPVINGSVSITRSQIRSLPRRLKIINGSLTVGDENIEYLNDDLTVNGRLYIWSSPNLKKLGKKINVREDLWIEGIDHTNLNTGIIEICDELECEELVLSNFHNKLILPKNLLTKKITLWSCPDNFINYISEELVNRDYKYNKDLFKISKSKINFVK